MFPLTLFHASLNSSKFANLNKDENKSRIPFPHYIQFYRGFHSLPREAIQLESRLFYSFSIADHSKEINLILFASKMNGRTSDIFFVCMQFSVSCPRLPY